MSASRALQVAIYEAIEAANIVYQGEPVPFYDGPPSDRDFPFMSLGPSDFVTDDYDCINGREETIQIDVWVREQGRLNGCKIIVDDLYDALHEVSLNIADPYAVNTCRVPIARTMKDRDGITAHGIVQVSALVETP